MNSAKRMSWVWAATVGGLLGAVVGCSEDPTEAAPQKAAATPADLLPQVPVEEPRPAGAAEIVHFQTTDGVTIVGTLRPGGVPDSPAVILVHQLGSTRAEWAPIVDGLSGAPGLTTLAIDMRGHGASTKGGEGRELAWREFSDEEWQGVYQDVLAAVAYLDGRNDLRPSTYRVAGSSMGSSAAIVAAKQEPRISAIAALSPGRAYRGVDALSPLRELGDRIMLAVAAREEEPAAEAAKSLERIVPRGRAQLVTGAAHGLKMTEEHPELVYMLVEFLRSPS